MRPWRVGTRADGACHGYQSLATTLQQVVTAIVIGLVFGVLYDRTRNLVGASLAHSVADFSGTAIPLITTIWMSPSCGVFLVQVLHAFHRLPPNVAGRGSSLLRFPG